MTSVDPVILFICFFNDTATTEIYTLSLHDALPISRGPGRRNLPRAFRTRPQYPRPSRSPCVRYPASRSRLSVTPLVTNRSEEHTSELQSRQYLVCRLLLEKKSTSQTRAVLRPFGGQ